MSDSQFFASSADANHRALNVYELTFRLEWQFDYRQGIRLCNQIRSGQASDSSHGDCEAAVDPV